MMTPQKQLPENVWLYNSARHVEAMAFPYGYGGVGIHREALIDAA